MTGDVGYGHRCVWVNLPGDEFFWVPESTQCSGAEAGHLIGVSHQRNGVRAWYGWYRVDNNNIVLFLLPKQDEDNHSGTISYTLYENVEGIAIGENSRFTIFIHDDD